VSSEVDEKLTEMVRKCEELYDMSSKKYSDSVWKEKLWGQIGFVVFMALQPTVVVFFTAR